MSRATLAAVLASLLSLPVPAGGAQKTSPLTLDLRVGAFAGAFDGMGVRPDSGGVAVIDARLTPGYASGAAAIQVPLSFEHRQTFGADLSETVLDGAVEPEYRLSGALRVGAEAGLRWTNRPGWPDLYQRTPAGVLPATDRYGNTAWRVGANLYSRPAAHQHLRLRYRYVSTAYVEDPNFNPTTPMHLTPRDNGQHHLDLSWRYRADDYAVAVRLDTTHRQDSVLLARQAGTGRSSGNPTQELNDVEPSLEFERIGLLGALDLSLQYAYEIRSDAFQGYYSYRGHNPRVVATWHLSRRTEAELRAETWFRTYGPDSKANTEDGKRLQETRARLRARFSRALGRGLTVRASAEWRHRTTNFPDYVPGVFDIRWDYDNFAALVGFEYQR